LILPGDGRKSYEVEGQLRIVAPEKPDIVVKPHQKGYTLFEIKLIAKLVLNSNSKEEYSH
jgi:hypothetical protein